MDGKGLFSVCVAHPPVVSIKLVHAVQTLATYIDLVHVAHELLVFHSILSFFQLYS